MELQKKKIFILVEGVADIRIMKELIVHINNNIVKPEKDLHELTLENEKIKVVLKSVKNGWANIKNTETHKDINQKSEEGFTCLVILDADDNSKDINGGFEKRKLLLKKIREDHNLNFECFLLPNNESDGDLEHILMDSIPKDRKEIFTCITTFRDCLNSYLSDDQEKKRLNNKTILYNHYAKHFDREKNPSFDFNSEKFNALKEFLEKHIKID